MVRYRITSPRSRTDRAADVLWDAFKLPGRGGVTTSDMVVVDCVKLRLRGIRPETRERIDSTLREAGFAPLRWTEDKGVTR